MYPTIPPFCVLLRLLFLLRVCMVTSEVNDVNPRSFMSFFSHDRASERFASAIPLFASSHPFQHPFGMFRFLFGSQASDAFGDPPSRLG